MATRKSFSWLVSQKSFIQLIGAEYELLRKSGSSSLVKFYVAAMTILFIFVISVCSIFYATELLVHAFYIEILLSIFVSLLFVFIYVFLLNTFSKNIFKSRETDKAKKWFQRIGLSDLIRTGFVVFMAFLIAKPIETYVFRKELDKEVVLYRDELYSKYKKRLNEINKNDLARLHKSLFSYKAQANRFPSPSLLNRITQIENEISSLDQNIESDLDNANDILGRSDFLLYRIRRVNSKTGAWLICLAIIGVFLLPGLLVYSISASDAYYEVKKGYEMGFVLEEYSIFENEYAVLFRENYGVDRFFYTKYLDPPFNTRLKPGPSYNSQQEFFERYSAE